MRGGFTRRFIHTCRNAAARAQQYAVRCSPCSWEAVSILREAKSIPGDVPKGHFVVYVGEDCERYVVEIRVLKHPLFRTLLDSAEEMFEFANGSKLHLPCDKCVLLEVLQCVGSNRNG